MYFIGWEEWPALIGCNSILRKVVFGISIQMHSHILGSGGAEMADDPLVGARKRAERAVEGMSDGPLKIAAFQTILAKLLTESAPTEQVQRVPVKAPAGRSEQPGTLTGRILAIGSEWVL